MTQGVCPSGWHLPARTEWGDLIKAVGNNPAKKLKARRSEWGDVYGTDEYGFAALPGGGLSKDGFGNRGSMGYWWTSTQGNASSSYWRAAGKDRNDFVDDTCPGCHVDGIGGTKTNHLSVRCVENAQ